MSNKLHHTRNCKGTSTGRGRATDKGRATGKDRATGGDRATGKDRATGRSKANANRKSNYHCRSQSSASARWLAAAWLFVALGSTGVAQAQSNANNQQVGSLAASAEALQKRVAVRFITGIGYPPFNYFDDDNILTGFNVDIARAICLEMGATCDVKAKPWDKLLPSLLRGEADAIVASQLISPTALQQLDFTDRYYHTPGRFVALRKAPKLRITPVGLEAKTIGAIKGTTHEAYLRDFFQDSRVKSFADREAAQTALLKGEIDLLFGDAISLSFWLNGTLSKSCCEFRGGAFSEPRYFGDGVGIAVTKGDRQLRALINKALKSVRASGRYEELFLRYFPIKFY